MASLCISFNVGHQMAPLALPHCLGLPYGHHQLVLSCYPHQPESHQLSLQKWLTDGQLEPKVGPQINLGPIKIEHLVYQLVEVERGKITQPLLFLCLLATRIKYIYMDNGIPTFNVTNYPM